MKRMLLLTICALMVASVATADHIGIYSDASGQSCNLGNIAGQFSTSAAVIHKFALGATGSRFKATFPAGTSFFAFNSTYVTVGSLLTDISVGYGSCRTDCIVLGTMLAIYGAGRLQIQAADLQVAIVFTDCSFAEHFATGGSGWVSVDNDCTPVIQSAVAAQCGILPVEQSTWGSVKSLYR
jgi:hypothetical protein